MQNPATPGKTRLSACIYQGNVSRWADTAMPLRIFIEEDHYGAAVTEALDRCAAATEGRVRYTLVKQPETAHIVVQTQFSELKFTGRCYRYQEENGAISRAVLFLKPPSQDISKPSGPDPFRSEVFQLVCRALGFGSGSLTYPFNPLECLETLRSLYRLPLGFNYAEYGRRMGLSAPFDIDDVLARLRQKQTASSPAQAPPSTIANLGFISTSQKLKERFTLPKR